ncbi:CsbD family protein [Aestuariibacter sp. AA17]|uniref:CsbD family protein n=1 Tax=Fluctibacter corallii TaxID=2984329 RepID=A0ABT3A585_9ALTE|nr:CsbD family protein [Aestuariibacter sp. AA17]MCV2883836.1 CsbD family protein [Aestuariibacter sp. AA17]
MNDDIAEGRWKQLRGEIKERYGKLTDSDIDRMEGKFENFYGTMQEKYGMSRDKAKKAFNELTR